MDMMTAAFVSIVITTLSVSVLTAAVGAVARARLALRKSRKRPRREFRRQATPLAGMPLAARRVHPQYLPVLQRARILRGRAAYARVRTARRHRMREHLV
jgi:hypothetical protein